MVAIMFVVMVVIDVVVVKVVGVGGGASGGSKSHSTAFISSPVAGWVQFAQLSSQILCPVVLHLTD